MGEFLPLWGENPMGCHHQTHLLSDVQGVRGRKRSDKQKWHENMTMRRVLCSIWWTLGFGFALFLALPNFLVFNKVLSPIFCWIRYTILHKTLPQSLRFKTTNVCYLSFCVSRIQVWLSWVLLARDLSWGCSTAVFQDCVISRANWGWRICFLAHSWIVGRLQKICFQAHAHELLRRAPLQRGS